MGDAPNFYPPRPRWIYIQVSDREGEAFDRLKAEMWPDKTEAEVGRKLLQDELIRLGVLELPEGNRAKGAGKR